jgi:hypothetical protein
MRFAKIGWSYDQPYNQPYKSQIKNQTSSQTGDRDAGSTPAPRSCD